MTLAESLANVEIVFRQLEFAIKMLSHCELGKFDPSDFDSDEIVRLESGDIHFPAGHFRDLRNFLVAANISVSLTFGATALVLNDAYVASGINPDPDSKDDKGKLRTLVHMVRCAYAHNIADPKWKVNGPYKKVLEFELAGEPFAIDLTKLDEQGFSFDQLGGHPKWFTIRDVALADLRCIAAREVG